MKVCSEDCWPWQFHGGNSLLGNYPGIASWDQGDSNQQVKSDISYRQLGAWVTSPWCRLGGLAQNWLVFQLAEGLPWLILIHHFRILGSRATILGVTGNRTDSMPRRFYSRRLTAFPHYPKHCMVKSQARRSLEPEVSNQNHSSHRLKMLLLHMKAKNDMAKHALHYQAPSPRRDARISKWSEISTTHALNIVTPL